eukprot:4984-Heterococcus_DN1.PRE.2
MLSATVLSGNTYKGNYYCSLSEDACLATVTATAATATTRCSVHSPTAYANEYKTKTKLFQSTTAQYCNLLVSSYDSSSALLWPSCYLHRFSTYTTRHELYVLHTSCAPMTSTV